MPRFLACPVLTLVLAATACADLEGPDGGEGGELGTELPDHDVELRCGAAVAPELAAVGPMLGGVALGPCGHVGYHDDQGQGWLIAPDGERVELVHASHRTKFAPTGDLLAWAGELDAGLRLRDLLSGEEREIVASMVVDGFGFVPSFADASRGAWLWSCEQGVLEKHDLSGSEVVAESVDCLSVVASTGSPRLGFADTDGRVKLADLDAGALVESEDVDFVAHDGSSRGDMLWIDHDGELIVHEAIEWQGDDDVDSEWPVPLFSNVLDRQGRVVLEATSGISYRQAARRGAPVFVVRPGEIVRFDAGAPSSVDATLDGSALAESGELFFNEVDQVLVVESVADEPLTSVGEFGTPVELRPSRSGSHLAVEHHSEICLVDSQGECDRILLALRRWSRTHGVAEEELLSTSPWNLEATLDDGSVLVVGAPVEAAGPTYMGEEPQPRVLWIDGDGEIVAELPAGNGDLAVRQTFALGEDRVLFEYQPESGIGELMLAGPDGFTTLAAGVDVRLLEAWVDARAQRVVFVGESEDGGTLWYGAL